MAAIQLAPGPPHGLGRHNRQRDLRFRRHPNRRAVSSHRGRGINAKRFVRNHLVCIGENSPARAPGRAVPMLWKFLKFGEYVHVGHGATFGLGKYEIGA